MKKRALPARSMSLRFCEACVRARDPRKAQAEAVFSDGLKEHDAQHEDPALAKFEEAYNIYPSPNVLFNIGRESTSSDDRSKRFATIARRSRTHFSTRTMSRWRRRSFVSCRRSSVASR